jgi:hypothetical protein
MNSRVAALIAQHIKTPKHKNLKEKEIQRSGRQLSLEETASRAKERQQKVESFNHDLTRALCYSAIPLYKIESDFGKLMRKYVPEAKSMPQYRQFREKYLDEVFSSHIEQIKLRIKSEKISVILDESPHLLGRPTVNVLFSFFDERVKTKSVFLVDVCFPRQVNSVSISNTLTTSLTKFDKTYDDVIAIFSDSASYLEKMISELKQSINSKVFHIKDVAHLIHISVDKALNLNEFAAVKDLIIKIGAFFKQSFKELQSFTDLLEKHFTRDSSTY